MKDNSTGSFQKNCPFGLMPSVLFAKPVTETAAEPRGTSIGEDYSVEVLSSIETAMPVLEDLAVKDDLILNPSFLELLEDTPPDSFRFYYLLFYKKNEVIGFAPFQWLEFNGRTHLNLPQTEAVNWWDSFRAKLIDRVVSGIKIRVLVGGNMLFTGDHSLLFRSNISYSKALKLAEAGQKVLLQHLRWQKRMPHIIGYKDIPESKVAEADSVLGGAYIKSAFSPDMVLSLNAAWNTFDDYLAAISSKYRVRVKRAQKKAKGIAIVELGTDDIAVHQDRIYELYNKVAESSEFNVLQLHRSFFLKMKKTFPDAYRLFGCFKDNEMVGFFTTLTNGEELEAHYLGFDNDINFEHQLYLNMLFEMVKVGLEEQCSSVNYARTSLEIKSSVGAEPHKMWCYYRHRNPLIQAVLPILINRYSQETPWTPRNPFKS